MRSRSISVALAAACAVLAVTVAAAEAKCTKLSFSVNDYGKEGPIRDAKNLLDKYIGEWTKQRSIKNYTVGKKDVTCELFLDVGVFDEHTCKATALVCWPDGAPGAAPAPPAAKPAPKPKAKSATG
jgi:hypothetical protein